jgi:HupE / UreJ protein
VIASTLYAVSLLLAIGNLGSPSLRRRWFVAAVVGSLAGFGLGDLLASQFQFAGDHALLSALSFNVGVAIGEVMALAIAYVGLRALFATMFGPTVGVIIVSALVGLAAWQWTANANPELAHELGHAMEEGFGRAVPILLWMVPAVVVGALAYWMPRGFGTVRVASLRDALLGRIAERDRSASV